MLARVVAGAVGTIMALLLVEVGPAAANTGCDAGDTATSVRTAGGDCFSFRASPNAKPGQPLVVFLHGDGGGAIAAGYWDAMVKNGDMMAAAANATFVVLVRPGYQGPGGRSTAPAEGGVDDYTEANVKLAAAAVTALKERFQPSRTIVGGTAGGAVLAALIMGHHPGLADAAWLTACPCQYEQWRAWRAQSTGRPLAATSLSPDKVLASIAFGARIVVVAGDKDQNALMRFSEGYVAAARAQGVSAELVVAVGATHGTVWRSRESAAALTGLSR